MTPADDDENMRKLRYELGVLDPNRIPASTIASHPNVLVVANAASDVWTGTEEKDFNTGTVVRFRRAKLYVRVSEEPDEQMRCSFVYDKALVKALGAKELAQEIAQQIVRALKA